MASNIAAAFLVSHSTLDPAAVWAFGFPTGTLSVSACPVPIFIAAEKERIGTLTEEVK